MPSSAAAVTTPVYHGDVQQRGRLEDIPHRHGARLAAVGNCILRLSNSTIALKTTLMKRSALQVPISTAAVKTLITVEGL